MEVAWKCISERLWKCLVGRYGGFFEEIYNEAYDDRAYHAMGLDAPAKYAPTPREGQCTVPKRLAKYGWWKCQQSNTYISPKNSCTYYRNSQSNQEVHKETSTPRRSVWGFVYPCASSTHGT